MPLTRRQREILDYLNEYSGDHGYAPSFDEIAERFDYASFGHGARAPEQSRAEGVHQAQLQ